jgi:hypothetical protein
VGWREAIVTDAAIPNPPRSEEWPQTRLRIVGLTRVLALGLISGFLLSPKLWLSGRSYPLTPVWDLLPDVPPPFDAIWLGAMLALLLAIVVRPQSRWLIGALILLAAASALLDQSRWQPWFYQYLAMFVALALANWAREKQQAQEAALNACRLILVATYVWSGVHKMNAAFVLEIYPWVVRPLLSVLPQSLWPLLHQMVYIVPLVEVGVGAGLLLRPTRPLAIGAATAMHLFLLVMLGPAGRNWNSIVWPWNLAMIGMVLVLFWQTPAVTPRSIVWPRGFFYARIVLVFFGVLPGLHLVGLWDAYLSAALYSGNTLDGHIRVSVAQRNRLPAAVRPDLKLKDAHLQIDLASWSLRELNAPAYPARRVYRHIAQTLATRSDPPLELILVIDERPDWRTGARRETISHYGGTEK